jgi:UDP-N-acetyl-D-glucosamine dehydrogenase
MSYKAKKYGFIPRFIETSGEINNFMKMHAINLVENGLEKADKRIYGSKISVMGLAYKKNINDTRESPSIKIIEELVNLGAEVKVYDPYVESIPTRYGIFKSEKNIDDAMSGVDCSLFVVDHDEFRQIDIELKVRLMNLPLVVDCKNIFKNNHNLIDLYLGLGKA